MGTITRTGTFVCLTESTEEDKRAQHFIVADPEGKKIDTHWVLSGGSIRAVTYCIPVGNGRHTRSGGSWG